MKGILEKRRYDSDFEFWCRCYTDLKFLAHYHTEIEMILVREGRPQITVSNRIYTCEPGDIIVIRPGDIHFNEYDHSHNQLDFIIFNPILLGEIYSSRLSVSPYISAELAKERGMSPNGIQLFDSLHKEMRARDKFYDIAVKSRLRSFWVEYLRYFTEDAADNTGMAPNRLSRIRVLLDYIDRHFDQDIPLTKAAELLGYDTFHCSKTFKAITGVNFVSYLNTVRVGKALEMLRSEDRSIIDIALDCGFHNPRTFNRVFKEITQMTPSAYLKLLKGGNVISPDDPAENHTILSFSESWV